MKRGDRVVTDNNRETHADADVIVIGSGFGGSVAAARLVDAGVSVLLLERGPVWVGAATSGPPRWRAPPKDSGIIVLTDWTMGSWLPITTG